MNWKNALNEKPGAVFFFGGGGGASVRLKQRGLVALLCRLCVCVSVSSYRGGGGWKGSTSQVGLLQKSPGTCRLGIFQSALMMSLTFHQQRYPNIKSWRKKEINSLQIPERTAQYAKVTERFRGTNEITQELWARDWLGVAFHMDDSSHFWNGLCVFIVNLDLRVLWCGSCERESRRLFWPASETSPDTLNTCLSFLWRE